MNGATNKSPRVLVTGATGFLGRHLIEALVREGYRNLRAVTTGVAPLWLEDLGVDVVEGSLMDVGVAERAANGAEVIYHLAGRVSRSPSDARQMYALHVEGTRNLCRAAVNARTRRIVLASSSGTIAVSENAQDLPDESTTAPLSIISRWPYYASKAYQEQSTCGTGKNILGQLEIQTIEE